MATTRIRRAATWTTAVALFLVSGCGAVPNQTAGEPAIRVVQHDEGGRGSIELIVQGDRYSFRMIPVLKDGQEGDDLFWFISNGTDALTISFDGADPGPDDEYRLTVDINRQPHTPEDDPALGYRVPDQDEVGPLMWFGGPCHRVGEGTYGDRDADRYECDGVSGGDSPTDGGTVWVDQEFRVALNPWGLQGEVEVDADFDVPEGTFDTSAPPGADVRIIRPPLRPGDPMPELHDLIWLTEAGDGEGDVQLSDYAGAPLVLAVIPRSVFVGDSRPPAWEVAAFQALSRLTQSGSRPRVLAMTADEEIPWYGGFVRRGIKVPIATRRDSDPYRMLEELGWDNGEVAPMVILVNADGTITDVLQGKDVTEDALTRALESLS